MNNTKSIVSLLLIILLLSLKSNFGFTQSNYTLQECEELYRKNNFLLLAEQLNIDIAQANTVQAKIWELPYISGEFNAINPQNRRVFDIGSKGQKGIAIEQLVYLGGKKKAEIEFAKSAIPIAQLTLEQLVRTHLVELKQSYYSIYFDNLKLNSLRNKMANIDTLVAAYSGQASKGNVPLKDVVRLQSLSLSLKNQYAEIQKDIFSNQAIIKIITGISNDIVPIFTEQEINELLSKKIIYQLGGLKELAIEKNTELQTINRILVSNDLFYKWQQTFSKPDLTIGASYDQRGGAFLNQANLTVGIPIPLWNRNKGNIVAAASKTLQTQNLKNQKELEIKTNVEKAFKEFQFQQSLFQRMSSESLQNFEIVYNGVIQNFQKQNITLIEFTDIIESYIESIVLLNDVKKQVILNGNNLNYIVNEKIF
ncbi:outer membrane efflux protein (plasmid) [Emticicia oligotrophica DSM 17448]|uniref:Outer membrane efflux protein n=1 Tax=Emticicia oligotrophica (strain DSM 17448 / CIP 109782 / MTCC 6937 / GPTSA100-15) TaxID=929562 RepID=A0ABM5N7S3_EMTOG|nr:TolC family protein [Emticicia oligotrophica]AFK05546.1 outer membrane efflux protein [Emticicia oligotrophica DSM 17448]